ERERERRRRSRLEGTDPLPRTLDAAPHRVVEHTAAGHLEVGEARAVEKLREPEQVGRRHETRERLLAENADRRVDQARHAPDLTLAERAIFGHAASGEARSRAGPLRRVPARVRAS